MYVLFASEPDREGHQRWVLLVKRGVLMRGGGRGSGIFWGGKGITNKRNHFWSVGAPGAWGPLCNKAGCCGEDRFS